MSKRAIALVVPVLLVSMNAQAEPIPAPPPPEKYEVKLRYRIRAFRGERAEKFRAMKKHLDRVGFVRDRLDQQRGDDNQELTNQNVDRMVGVIDSKKVDELLRAPNLQIIQLKPQGKDLPGPDQPVRVEVLLSANLSGGQRESLYNDVIDVLKSLGFLPALGYEHRAFSRIVGRLPVKSADPIFDEIRLAPASWKLLPKDLLVQMRKTEMGESYLLSLLEIWRKTPGGDKIMKEVIADWSKEDPAKALLQKLPREVLRFPDVVEEQLVEQIGKHPQSGPILESLLEKVLSSPAGPKLMVPLLERFQSPRLETLLPLFFRRRSPIQVLELRPDLPLPPLVPKVEVVPATHEKLAPGLRALIENKAQADTRRRIQIILSYVPSDLSFAWRRSLYRAVPSLTIEGRLGALVSVVCKPSETPNLTALQLVSTVRLPRTASSNVITLSEQKADWSEITKSTGLKKLHDAGHRGKGQHIALLSDDFRGWSTLKGKTLPADTEMMDLTIERNYDWLPDPYQGPANEIGSGARMAEVVHRAAPEAKITLLRVDRSSPALLRVALRYLSDRAIVSESLQARLDTQKLEREDLDVHSTALAKERIRVFSLFTDNKVGSDEFERARQKLKADYLKKQEQFNQDTKEFMQRVVRSIAYRKNLGELGKINIVVNGLTWLSGHSADGNGFLTRFINGELPEDLLWIQACGETRGQVWTGVYRDEDNDGVMEIAPRGAKLPSHVFSNEQVFLAWQKYQGGQTLDLPTGQKIRIAVQWSEVHDPRYARNGEDPYRTPLNRLKMVVLRQLDPQGKTRPADEFEIAAQTVSLPQRLTNSPTGSVYEHVIDLEVKPGSRYILRIRGDMHKGTQPRSVPTLPAAQIQAEIRPRIIVEGRNAEGYLVLDGYRTKEGELSMPADSRRAIVVGALNAKGKPQSYTSTGVPYGIALASSPSVLFPDRMGLTGMEKLGGSAISAAYAAGYAASLLSMERTVVQVRRDLTLASKRIQK